MTSPLARSIGATFGLPVEEIEQTIHEVYREGTPAPGPDSLAYYAESEKVLADLVDYGSWGQVQPIQARVALGIIKGGLRALLLRYAGMRGRIRGLKAALREERDRRKSIEQDAIGALYLVARIREAIGDNGRRMQDELVEHLRDLASGGKAPDDLAMDLIEARQEVERVKAHAKHDYGENMLCRELLGKEVGHLQELLDGARDWVHDPVLLARITAAVPPKARPVEA